MKKNDIILMVVIIVVAGLVYLGNNILSQKDNTHVVVAVDGVDYGEYNIDKEQKIKINNTNTILIKNKEVDMISSNCPDKLCLHQKSIYKSGQSIICLPNKVIVKIVDDSPSDVDAVAN